MKFNRLSYNTKIFYLFFLAWSVLFACNDSRSPSAPADKNPVIEFDSIRKSEIDTTMKKMEPAIIKLGYPQKLPYPIYNPLDTIFYWLPEDGKSARISIEWKLPEEISWPTFFVHDGELIFIRYRNLQKIPPDIRVSETMIYLDNGKIIYCEERSKPLQEGDTPGSLRKEPFTKSTRTYAEVEKDYKESWNLVYDFMQKANALPDAIKK